MRKTFDYDTIQIGEVLGYKKVLITEEVVATCAHSYESTHPWYFGESPYGGPIAPPTIFDNDMLNILDEQYERFGSIHAKQAWEFKNPLHIGQTVTLTVTVTEKFFRRERPYIVMELVAVDENGVEICRSKHTSLMTLKP
ncbi:FAS1-like dehydratase domain-containing protein [Candidatus Entotheonella palauensis]|uniref:FAS1-like dehydratase domain-containing protein n=1 Tax=Candidatus Entotheonella palauensis TaxID=93172 RepID=UPI000B7DE94C|nr:MaoC family dehydratase N-terminal domain-containing protein [Candidatus Entotheonella palauensis]